MKLNAQPSQRLGLIVICFGVAINGTFGMAKATATEVDAVAVVAAEIRTEAVRASNDPGGKPLPLACSWTCGHYQADFMAGWRPDNQMQLIEEGHHLLPWFNHPTGAVPEDPDDFQMRYFKDAIAKARELRLPLTFIASQWESGLSRQPYVDLPSTENPNVVTVEGEVLKKVSPFGPVALWSQIGATFTDNPWMKQIQEWYPDPPLVIFLSNNEHSKLHWSEVETSQRYLDTFGPGRDSEFKREVVSEGWIERYRALQAGMRDALEKDAWRDQAVFVGYSVGDLAHFGRWGGWMHHSLYRPGRLNPLTEAWDGGSSSYYTHDWNPSTDYQVWSPQVEFMNNTLVKREALQANPRFWYEISIWDGYHNNTEREKSYPSVRGVYRRAGQIYNSERYGGFVQFGMWLMRPRTVRDYRGWTEPWNDRMDANGNIINEGGRPYFMAIVEAVDRVHNNSILRDWWRHGERVVNPARLHPYQAGIPQEYQNADRWFLLECRDNLGPEVSLELKTEIPVFSLALVQGAAPERRWLLYAHSPLGDRHDVIVTIPGYQDVVITSKVAGSFYTVDEKTGAGATEVPGTGATHRSWVGGTGEWHEVSNWDGGVSLPGSDDDVMITNIGSNVTLTNSVSVRSLTLSKTLTFTNWNTCLNVAGDIMIAHGGMMTSSGPFMNTDMSNRVNVVCDNFIVEQGGSVNVDAKGYAGGLFLGNNNVDNHDGQGLGGGGSLYYSYEGASYGGFGALLLPAASYYATLGRNPYGVPEAPEAPGSGGGGSNSRIGGAGGGAVRIVASGSVTVNGTVTANGEYAKGPGWIGSGSGSGGGIYIACQHIEGAGGNVSANGGNAFFGPTVAGGGGGRIAVHYDRVAQAAIAVPNVNFEARGGYDMKNGAYTDRSGDIGTLWFPDTRFWSDDMAHVEGQLFGATNWTAASLTLTNRWVGFSEEGFVLAVTGNVAVDGPYAGLSLGGPLSFNYSGGGQDGNGQYRYGEQVPAHLEVGGDLLVTNKARMFVYSSVTDAESPDYGARVAVNGTLRVATNGWVYLSSHPTNGGSVKFEVGNLAVDAGGTIRADKGFIGGNGVLANGYGPGGGQGGVYWNPVGAGYGGVGGGGSLTYGSSNAPTLPGSGGQGGGGDYRSAYGKSGGGLVWIEALNRMDISGTLSADAQAQTKQGSGGAGSGGGVYLRCKTFAATPGARISAQGGSAHDGGGGGGGRIAIWRLNDVSIGAVTTSVTSGLGKEVAGALGTVVWGWLPAQGTLFLIQ